MTMISSGLRVLRDVGLTPDGILDVGAYEGSFARNCREIWPKAYILMVDALAEKEESLANARREMGNSDYELCLLGGHEASNVPFFVAHAGRPNPGAEPIMTGSSKYRELTDVFIEQRSLDQRRLDFYYSGIGPPLWVS